MSVYYVPSLQPIEFARFRALNNSGLPETFEDWSVAQALRRRALAADGHHVIGVYVGPADFGRYCRSMNRAADIAALDALAMRIGTGVYDSTESYDRARAQTVVVEDTRSGPAFAGDVPARRRHWWSSWRRPGFLRFFGRRRPFAERVTP
ncbi:MAG TPA: hypothetical protein VN900_10230 [Stellaceae bacterium]|jgi:hypothetical protein|nr:hypothetical protein [Stellaceae bacterium]